MSSYQGKRFKKSDDGQRDTQGPHSDTRGAHAARAAQPAHTAHAARAAQSAQPVHTAHAARAAQPAHAARTAPSVSKRVGAQASARSGGSHVQAGRTAARSAYPSAQQGVSPVQPVRPHAQAGASPTRVVSGGAYTQAGRQSTARRQSKAGRQRASGYYQASSGRAAAGSRRSSSQSRASASRPSRARIVISRVLIGAGIVLILVAAGIFIAAQIGYQQSREAYDNLAQYITLDDSEGDGVPVVDWDALAEISEDIVAWIYIPNTNINYPVVQGDTNDEYLRALPDGTYNSGGSIMLDSSQIAPGMVEQQTTIYGHHMSDGSMFYTLEETLDQDRFDEITTVYYLTPEKTYRLTPLFTARVHMTYTEAAQGSFGSTEALQEYLSDLREYAQAEASDVDERTVDADQVLSLITCSGISGTSYRAIMVCTITEEYSTS